MGHRIRKGKSCHLLLILTLILFLGFSDLTVGDETKWVAVGMLHDWYSSAGCEIEVGRRHLISDQQDGLRWPAQFKWQDSQAAKALWIGATNYYDPLVDNTFDYKVVHIGPRVLDEYNEFMPVEFKLIGRFNHPSVFVDGIPATDMTYMDEVDEIDETLNSNRLLCNIVNTSIGITLTRKIYAFSQQNHDNYFIYDYIFKNTGICNQDSSITHEQTLEGVYFFFQYRYAICREGGPFGYYWLPQSTAWGHNTMNNVLYGNPFRCIYSWHGRHSSCGFDNIGGPYATGDGHLGAAQFPGVVTLHADVSTSDNSDDPLQPTSTPYLGSDEPITYNNNQFNAAMMSVEYAVMSSGHPENTHAEEVGEGYADLWGGTPGGFSQCIGFGPYTLAPGDSIHIALAEGVSGLSRDLCYSIGDQWLNGSGPFILPDGSATNDRDEYKNEWVYTGIDSILQTFARAEENWESGFDIPQPPPPPATFEVFSDSDRIHLTWSNNAESWPNFAGYKIYRSVGTYDTTYQEIFACGQGTGHPDIVNSYEDTDVTYGHDYYYYIVSFDDGSTNDIQPGVPLRSSMFWTRTIEPAYLRDYPMLDADLYVDPNGSDDNSGLTPDEPLQTITAALDRILSYILRPHTIYLAEGNYSPSTNGESYPLNLKSYVSLSGASEETTILDAEGVAGVLYCSDDVNFVVENLTIRNGVADHGGGVFCASSTPTLTNVTIVGNSANYSGGGIWCIENSDLSLSNVTISGNYANDYGGGIYFSSNSSATFDSDNRCNIFMNDAGSVGFDLYSVSNVPFIDPPSITVVLDTFTVLYPTDYYAYPSENFTFDILNFLVEQAEADLYVDPVGNNDNSGLSPEEPLQTITYALTKIYADSLHPHTIYLAEGTYSPSTNGENYQLYCRSYVSLSGAAEETTILDAEGVSRVLYCYRDRNFIIENLTIRNGVASSGGGIICWESSPSLTNVTISENSAGNRGGGIYCSGSSPSLVNVTVSTNTAEYFGGGIHCYYNSNPSLENVTISGNTASVSGGGIYFGYYSGAIFDTVNRCDIFLNNADGVGYDLYAGSDVPIINVVVDTFTVLYPTDVYAYPVSNFTFDILNCKIEQAEADLYVNPNGNDDNSGLSPDEPLQTITYALTLIFADSLRPHNIYLAEGIYSPSTTGESYPLNLKSYVSLSGAGEGITILDAEGEGGVLYCSNTNNFVIENLTIRNGAADYGGGIYFMGSNPVLTNVTISGDSAGWGGGIYCESSYPSFVNVTISENYARYGGGIYFISSSPTLTNVTISEDSARYGAGIYCYSSNPNLTSVTIYGNSAASRGGGIYCSYNSNPTMINAILWNDSPQEIYFFLVADPNSVTIAYSDVEGGEAAIITTNGTVNWLDGNIDSDPLFVGGDPFDFHLTENSPCIDAGTAFFEWEGDTLVNLPDTAFNGNAPDMGAFESPYIVEIEESQIVPNKFVLYQNYPNPFNPITTFKYGLPKPSNVSLKIYNILGQEVTTLVDKHQIAGYHQARWDASGVGSGVYFYKITAGEYSAVKKCIILK
ncbi:DUF1565 domain-containing protein [candidate division KSB1 bacterium]|nr:DUF1565 domain-containing protein [candidate division KSB1 bacterium]